MMALIINNEGCSPQARTNLGVKEERGWPFGQGFDFVSVVVTDESPGVIFIIINI
jgi:hypothetical protein